MELLFDWVRNIAYFFIFITVVVNLLPHKKYEKYLKLFAGMVLILIVIQPITKGFRLDESMAHYFESFYLKAEAGSLAEEILGMEQVRLGEMLNQYENKVGSDLSKKANDLGFGVKESVISMKKDPKEEDFGEIEQVFMSLYVQKEVSSSITPVEPVVIGWKPSESAQKREENQQIKLLREQISKSYGVEENNIEIQLEDE